MDFFQCVEVDRRLIKSNNLGKFSDRVPSGEMFAASLPYGIDCEFYSLMEVAFLWVLQDLEVKSPPPPSVIGISRC